MKLERCRDQPSKTLDEFYSAVAASDDPDGKACGAAMLAIIARLRALDDSREVCGLTSHLRLCLLASDRSSPWYVIVFAAHAHLIAVECLVGDDQYDRIEVSNLDDAVAEILRAMDRSGGWPRGQSG